MNHLQVIEGLCKVCELQAGIIRGLASSLSEEAALAHSGLMEEAARQYRNLMGEELNSSESKGSDQTS